jgi:hypothetical protein
MKTACRLLEDLASAYAHKVRFMRCNLQEVVASQSLMVNRAGNPAAVAMRGSPNGFVINWLASNAWVAGRPIPGGLNSLSRNRHGHPLGRGGRLEGSRFF